MIDFYSDDLFTRLISGQIKRLLTQELLFLKKSVICTSASTNLEYRDMLAREKFHFPAETVDIVMGRLAAVSMNINATDGEYTEIGDQKGRCFFAVTMTGDHVFRTYSSRLIS